MSKVVIMRRISIFVAWILLAGYAILVVASIGAFYNEVSAQAGASDSLGHWVMPDSFFGARTTYLLTLPWSLWARPHHFSSDGVPDFSLFALGGLLNLGIMLILVILLRRTGK